MKDVEVIRREDGQRALANHGLPSSDWEFEHDGLILRGGEKVIDIGPELVTLYADPPWIDIDTARDGYPDGGIIPIRSYDHGGDVISLMGGLSLLFLYSGYVVFDVDVRMRSRSDSCDIYAESNASLMGWTWRNVPREKLDLDKVRGDLTIERDSNNPL